MFAGVSRCNVNIRPCSYTRDYANCTTSTLCIRTLTMIGVRCGRGRGDGRLKGEVGWGVGLKANRKRGK